MFTFHLAWRASAGPGNAQLTTLADNGVIVLPPPCPLSAPIQLTVLAGADGPSLVTVTVDPPALTVTPAAEPATLHYFRLADATVKPLPPTPPALVCQPGDAYVAVTPAAARLAASEPGGASAAIARFIHLRDYFNADKLAAALLAHLVELGGGAEAAGAGVLVVEAR